MDYYPTYAFGNNGRGPPVPPKELGIVKETHSGVGVEMDGGSDAGSLDSEQRFHLLQQQLQQNPPPKRKVRILSLDGGGIRGYSTLVILGELMHQVYVQEHGKAPKSPNDLPRPCDYFDLIGGNGTGGLIALMLGRMRMDVESCKSYYVSLTRFVFITDKTLLGMPYGKTLFKASRLEEAIKHCVRESTRFDQEKITPHSPPPAGPEDPKPLYRRTDSWRRRNRSASQNTTYSEERGRTGRPRRNIGNPEAPLLDTREGACKTFVTAMLEGSRKGAAPVLLRSYPSSAESMPSYRTTIWQAGRATCATAAAFKAITIDQTTFLDEGAGMYNPAFQVLDEAHLYEFPDCDIGVFASIGTGKRQKIVTQQAEKREWWEGVAFEGFAEAKRRLMRRIDDCERVHRELVEGDDGGRPKLAQGGVQTQDYYRFNVEVGVGEFGMNEWNRLSEVATGTRRYLGQRETSKLVKEAARKLVLIEKQGMTDGTKIKFRPSKLGTGDGYIAELPAQEDGAPNLQSHPAFQPTPPQIPKYNDQQIPQLPQITQITPVMMPDEKFYSSPTNARPQQQQQQFPVVPPARRPSHPPPVTPPPEIMLSQASPVETPTMVPPMVPPKPTKEGKVLVPAAEQNYYADDTPNPEIRVTSPTTVAGGSDEEDEEVMSRRRRRRGSRSRRRSRSGGSLAGVME
ncbi:Similar to Calcium-independent phospholipase A2-gamma; acc. no. Q8K1N1 [Pyronema omphalodes CBS 100304]|uniref:Similar to Calcium-independent phospholipase A2-gamma acc. no. Q8K1N1 n=1 Tax=Pyronema omphalodes (strain CBS 100304) TaxID=1076935 RepID=U4KXW0_PYROM|nr:Similar to Calcium-independent phospholipase A2-gamma; acc. no. Q8K1N1 [Pyronema omphalodes CBS 100304]